MTVGAGGGSGGLPFQVFFLGFLALFFQSREARLRPLDGGMVGRQLFLQGGDLRLQVHDSLIELVEPFIAHLRGPADSDLIFENGIVIVDIGVVVLELGFELQLLLLQAAETFIGLRHHHLVGVQLCHVGLELFGQAAHVFRLELHQRPFQVIHPIFGLFHFVAEEVGGEFRLVVLYGDVGLGELGDQFADHGLGLKPVGVGEGDGKGRCRAAASHIDSLNADGLIAHILDDVFHGIPLALFRVEIQRRTLDQLDQAAAAEDLLPHLLQALLHLHVDHGGHQAVGNLLRSDAQDRLRHVGIGPEERDHYGDDQAGEQRPDQPRAVAAKHVDIVFDVGGTAGHGHEILCCCHKMLLSVGLRRITWTSLT